MKVSSRSFGPLVLAVLMVGAVALAASASTSAGTNATCSVKTTVKLKPGLTPKPSMGTFKSIGGGVSCQAGSKIKGHPVGKSSAFAIKGIYGTNGGDTCDHGAGNGKGSITWPQPGGGSYTAGAKFTFSRTGSVVTITGTIAGANLSGTLQFTPVSGQDCVVVPVTKAKVSGTVKAQG